jgi:hypothetical protein
MNIPRVPGARVRVYVEKEDAGVTLLTHYIFSVKQCTKALLVLFQCSTGEHRHCRLTTQ